MGLSTSDEELRKTLRRSVFFERRELNQILWAYGRGVAEGEWRDYAIDSLPDRAIFCIFRRSGDAPLYRIEKTPELAKRQGAYQIVGVSGAILRRGRELDQVLRFFERKRFAVVDG